MLYSHVLDSAKRVIAKNTVEVLRYEAVRNVNQRNEVWQFVYGAAMDIDFRAQLGESRMAEFWRIYNSVNPWYKVNHPLEEARERDQFTRRPFYVALKDGVVVGGLWFDKPELSEDLRCAPMHIIIEPAHRKCSVGTVLLDKVEPDAAQKFDALSYTWSPDNECNQAEFFGKRGYQIEHHAAGLSTATKSFRKVPLELRV